MADNATTAPRHAPVKPAWLMFVTAILGVVACLYLTLVPYEWFQDSSVFGAVCGGAWGDCKGVVESGYGQLLGVPTSMWGVAFYVTIALCATGILASGNQNPWPIVRFVLVLSVVALLFDIYLGYAMFARVGQVCPVCLGTYLLNGIVLAVSLWLRARLRRVDAPVRGVLSGKLLPGSIVAANLAIAAAALALPSEVVETPLAAGPIPARPDARSTPDSKTSVAPDSQTLDRLRQYLRGATLIDFSTFAGQPIRGPDDAATTIVVFGDFLCPQCRTFNKNLDVVRARHPGEIRVVFINYPLDSACNDSELPGEHVGACILAQTGESAHDQGLFWPVHDFLFADPANADAVKVAEFLKEIGIDARRYNADVRRDSLESVHGDIDIARQIGIKTTPSMILNRRLLIGALAPEAIEAAIDETLRLDAAREDD